MKRKFQFYIVPTPIGNLSDITLRAIDVLKDVDLIACEDTRTTQKLLNHYDIKTKTVSYHKYNEKSRADALVDIVKSGQTVALVSDAGSPMICDPGSVLLKTLKDNNIEVTSLPGACAVTTFLSQVPRDNEEFVFVGFFPKTSTKSSELLTKFAGVNLVFYESPNRLIDTLKLILNVRGNVKVALGRELTKMFEEVLVDSAENLIQYFSDGVKGEIVVMVYSNDMNSDFEIQSKIKQLKEKGFKSKEIATILSTLYNCNKNDVYNLAID